MSHPIVLVGGGPAILLGALELAKRGKDVVLVNAAPVWGGHFAGIHLLDRQFDIGMILLEASSFNADPGADPRTYNPAVRNDCGRFFFQVAETMEDLSPLHDCPQPQMLFRGKFWNDPVLSNHLDFLNAFSPCERGAMAKEWQEAVAKQDPNLHARFKTTSPGFRELSFEAASAYNHGALLHEQFFGPLTQKILAIPARDLLARYHRIAWLPLYYPETLLDNLGTNPKPLAETRFVYPKAGDVGALIRSLVGRLEQFPNLTIQREGVVGLKAGKVWDITLKSGKSLNTDHLVWGMDHGNLLQLTQGTPVKTLPKATLAVGFARVPSDQMKRSYSSLFLPDSGGQVYRVTNQSVCSGTAREEHLLLIELNPATLEIEPDNDTLAAMMKDALIASGTVDENVEDLALQAKVFKNALILPIAENQAIFEEERSACQNLGDNLTLVGPAGGFFTASMNDQIVQGLKIGLTLGAPP